MELENVLPMDIEKRSFQIITDELEENGIYLPEKEAPIIKRCIHTSADFEYAENLVFSEGAVEKALQAIRNGASIVTDTQMGRSGINRKKLNDFGGQVFKYAKEIFLWSAKIAVQIFRTVSFFAQTAARAPKTRNSVNTAARSSVPTAWFAPRAADR